MLESADEVDFGVKLLRKLINHSDNGIPGEIINALGYLQGDVCPTDVGCPDSCWRRGTSALTFSIVYPQVIKNTFIKGASHSSHLCERKVGST